MTKEISDNLHSQHIFKYDVFEIAKDYFGEDRVIMDWTENPEPEALMSHSVLIIHFPQITVSNSKGQSVDIYDLFVKFCVSYDGKILGANGHLTSEPKEALKCMRTTYTYAQVMSGYTHSHLPSYTDCGGWENPCLGTSPMVSIVRRLFERYDEDSWKMFFYTLDTYLQWESLEGGPYIRMEVIGSSRNNISISHLGESSYHYREDIDFPITVNSLNGLYTIDSRDLIKRLLKTDILRYNFSNNQYGIANSDLDFMVYVSNLYIEMLRERGMKTKRDLVSKTSLNEYILNNNQLRSIDRVSKVNVDSLGVGDVAIHFGRREFRIKIIDYDNPEFQLNNTILLLPSPICGRIYRAVLYYVNNFYGNKTRIKGQTVLI